MWFSCFIFFKLLCVFELSVAIVTNYDWKPCHLARWNFLCAACFQKSELREMQNLMWSSFNIICFRCNLKFSVLKLKLLFALNVEIIYTLYKFEMTNVGIRTLIFSKHTFLAAVRLQYCVTTIYSVYNKHWQKTRRELLCEVTHSWKQ